MHGVQHQDRGITTSAASPTIVGIEEFEGRLSSRTKVPAERLSEFMEWPGERLRREADLVSRVVKRFADAVVNSMENARSADEFLRGLDLKTISRDHDWRAIFSTLRAEEFDDDDYKRTVMVKYLQYLSFRRRLLEFIYSRRQGLEETDGYTELNHYPSAGRHLARPESLDDFARLPMGETVELKLRASGSNVEVMLAAHMFRIVGGQPPSVLDQNGVTYYVKNGRNMVGRHPESDIVVDQDFHDVSRAHLVMDWDPDAGCMRLTDLSTRGTNLRRRVLDRAARFAV